MIKKGKNKKKPARVVTILGQPEPEEEKRPPKEKKEKKKPKENAAAAKKEFVSREFKEVEGGRYDELGFYILPNQEGFFDPDGYYFDGEGFDKFGGYYDEEGNYFPGEANKHEFPARNEQREGHRRG